MFADLSLKHLIVQRVLCLRIFCLVGPVFNRHRVCQLLNLLLFFSPGILEWPFWTKLVVVAIGFTGGLLFMYFQCKVYVQLWKRLKAYNRVIYVQNCPETNKKSTFEKSGATEPNTENKDALGNLHAETNGSHYTEREDYRTDILHV